MENPIPRTVSAHAVGIVDVSPDGAEIGAGIQVTQTSLAAARDEAARQASAVIAAAKKAGVPASDIRTSRFSIYPQRSAERKGKPAAIVAYDVQNALTFIVRDLEQLPNVLDAVIAAGANQISGPEFFVQHPETFEDEARQRAVASARHRAEVVAAAAGATVGRVISIVDGTPRSGPAPRMMLAKLADAAPPTPIEAGTGRVSASVEVVWELV